MFIEHGGGQRRPERSGGEAANADSSLDLGLNLFDPPNAAGSSSSQFLITRDSLAQFAESLAGTNSNLYFLFEASPVPRPSVPDPNSQDFALGGVLLIAAIYARRRAWCQ